jgi:hypothetical protein
MSLTFLELSLINVFTVKVFAHPGFPTSTLAEQGEVGKVPQLCQIGLGSLKVGEVSVKKLRPGWRQVVSRCTMELCTVVKMIYT